MQLIYRFGLKDNYKVSRLIDWIYIFQFQSYLIDDNSKSFQSLRYNAQAKNRNES